MSIVDVFDPNTRRPAGLRNVRQACWLAFDDTDDPNDKAASPPMRNDVMKLLRFGLGLREYFGADPRAVAYDDQAVLQRPRVLVHCFAGSCRSTAAAVALYAQALGPGWEKEAVEYARASTESYFLPNRLVVSLADELLDRKGLLVAAVDALNASGGTR